MPAKHKISVTVSADVLALVDRAAERSGSTRSATIENWLRGGASRAAESSIEEATAAYYAALRGDETIEQEAIARASSRAATKLSYDVPPARRRRKGRTG